MRGADQLPTVSLFLFGTPRLSRDEGTETSLSVQRHRLAVLALLATAPGQRLTRDKLISVLWPEKQGGRARHLLNVAVHEIRKSLGNDAVRTLGDDLQLNNRDIVVDTIEFDRALAQGDRTRAAELYAGPLLDGFYLNDAPDFERWLDRERSLRAERLRDALEELATASRSAGDNRRAIRWLQRLSSEDPYNTRYVIQLMLALESVGDSGNAVQIAQKHEALLRQELAAEPDPALQQIVRRLQAAPQGLPAITVAFEAPRAQPEVDARSASASTTTAATSSRPVPWFTRRGARVAGVVAIAAIVAAVAYVVHGWRDRTRNDRTVVAHFENRTGDPALDPVGFMVADWITRGIMGLGFTEVVSSDEVLRSTLVRTGDSTTAGALGSVHALAQDARARFAIIGSYYMAGDTVAFQARIVDGDDGRVRRAIDEVRAPVSSLATGVSRVRDQVLGALATLLDERTRAWSDHASQPPTLEAYRRYSQGMDAFLTARGTLAQRLEKLSHAAAQFRAAAALDSTFIAPLIWAVYSHWRGGSGTADDILARLKERRDQMAPWDRAMTDHLLAQSLGDWPRAYAAAHEAVRYAPDSEWLYKAAYSAWRLNRPRDALNILGRINPERGWMRDWLGYWGLRAEAHHLLGEYEQELAAAGKMREKQPADFGGRFYQFRALVGLGDLTAALVAAREAIDVEDSPLAHRFVDELRLHRYDPAADTLAKLAAGWLGARLSQRTPELLPTAKWHLSFLLREAGQLTEAQSLLEELASSDSVPGRRFWYLALLGQVLALRGDSIAVGRVLVSMDSIAPRAEDSGAQVIVRAELYARLGHFDIAQRLLQTFIARSQNYGAIAHTLPTDLAVLFRDYAPFQKLAQPRG